MGLVYWWLLLVAWWEPGCGCCSSFLQGYFNGQEGFGGPPDGGTFPWICASVVCTFSKEVAKDCTCLTNFSSPGWLLGSKIASLFPCLKIRKSKNGTASGLMVAERRMLESWLFAWDKKSWNSVCVPDKRPKMSSKESTKNAGWREGEGRRAC